MDNDYLDQDLPDLASAYAEMQNLLIASSTMSQFLHELATLAAAVVPPVASCGITVRRDRQPMTVAASGSLADEVDELQYGRGVGPCLQAMQTGHTVIVADLATEERWGDYPAHALAQGVCSSISIPLTADGAPVGALNLYTTTVHSFTSAEIAQVSAFAGQASGALALAARQADQMNLEAQLIEALASRSVIDQAIGVIMGQRLCSSGDAFAALRTKSQHRNVKLHLVAAEMVQSQTGYPAQPPQPFVRRR